jgi:transposase
MANDVGRPSQLDDEQFLLKIKELTLQYKNEKEIAEILKVSIGTWDYWKWKNYQGFADKLLTYKHERIIRKAESNVEILLESEDERVVADMTKFSLETLGKSNYSKKTESDIRVKEMPKPILENVQLNNSVAEDNSTN